MAVLLSTSSALLLCESIGSIPGNEGFSYKIEYTKLSQVLISSKFFRSLVHVFLYASLESIIIASLVLSAQSLDSLFVISLGTSCGIGIYPDLGQVCTQSLGSENSPYGDRWMIMTAGLVVTLIIVIPMTWMNLSNNSRIQIAWIITTIHHGLDPSRIPFIGKDQSQVVGGVLFNYAFITSVPSVVSELKRDVSIKRLIWTVVLITTTFYLSLGILGAASYQIETSTSIIAIIRKVELQNGIAEVATYMFPFLLLFSIPVYAIVLRYNLMRSGLCKTESSSILVSLLPWILVIPLQTGHWLSLFTNWTTIIFICSSNFIIPFWLYILSQRRDAYPPEMPISPMTKVYSINTDEEVASVSKSFRAFACCERKKKKEERKGEEKKDGIKEEDEGKSIGLAAAWLASV
ncbi:15197_t:CDS:2 [Acaulospora colombiana]|uniref:15197_t:CDS:1 n=1 Tax=Acaulospora colombiana TaxID=27376 RepID=A0ACA9LKV4_9GLOM|nr:15197_t:CDS:2 [Acaulospora colombiana]